MKVSIIVILVLFVSSSDINLVRAGMSLSYKIINDRKSQATVTSSIQSESLAQYKQGTCEFMSQIYACLNPNVHLGWRYIFMGR